MVSMNNDNKTKKMKQINQLGINAMLYKFVEQAGGKVNFPVSALSLPEGSTVRIKYNSDNDSFDVETIVIEKKNIIAPSENLKIPNRRIIA